jgi:hypothetical protein
MNKSNIKKAIGLGTFTAFIKQPNKHGAITYNKKGIGSGEYKRVPSPNAPKPFYTKFRRS